MNKTNYEKLFSGVIKDSYLIIAGDLCEIYHDEDLLPFFDYTTTIFKYIIYIAGNHEYYRNYLDDNIIREKVKKYSNVIFLQNDFKYFFEDNFLVYGTTLWTESSGDTLLDTIVAQNMMDYKCIYQKTHSYKMPITRQQMINLHHNMFDKLKEFFKDIEKDKNYTKIIVTHHLPTYKLISDEYIDDACNSGFASNLDDKIKKLDFDYWICGHTHKSKEYDFELESGKKAKMIINPYGYLDENPYFDSNKCIDIK